MSGSSGHTIRTPCPEKEEKLTGELGIGRHPSLGASAKQRILLWPRQKPQLEEELRTGEILIWAGMPTLETNTASSAKQELRKEVKERNTTQKRAEDRFQQSLCSEEQRLIRLSLEIAIKENEVVN